MLARQLPIKTAEIHVCAFAPDGARALIGSQGNPVGLWELTTGRLLREYEHAGPVWALAWSTEQHFLSLDGTMRLWEVETGECLREFDGRHARCVTWSADTEQVLSASNESLGLMDFASGQTVRRLEGHTDGIYCAAFDVKRRRALSGSRDRTVRVWDLETGECLRVFERHPVGVVAAAFSQDQRRAFSCDWNGGIGVRDLEAS